jgi:hypothetical protein
MPILIAKTYDGKVENIVFSKSRELAVAYWHGKGIYPHSIHTVCDKNMEDHPTGVLPILSTKEMELSGFGKNSKKYLVVE